MDLSSQQQTTDSFPLLYHQNPTSSSSSSSSSSILQAPDIQHLISKYHNPASASASDSTATGFDHSNSTLDGQASHHLQPLMCLGAAEMASYYQDPSAAQQHNWMLKESVRQYGMANPLAYASNGTLTDRHLVGVGKATSFTDLVNLQFDSKYLAITLKTDEDGPDDDLEVDGNLEVDEIAQTYDSPFDLDDNQGYVYKIRWE
ncbi:hypothetical protein ACLOJK_035398 [Asimina triloba]